MALLALESANSGIVDNVMQRPRNAAFHLAPALSPSLEVRLDVALVVNDDPGLQLPELPALPLQHLVEPVQDLFIRPALPVRVVAINNGAEERTRVPGAYARVFANRRIRATQNVEAEAVVELNPGTRPLTTAR